ncbi:hypothetical protein E4A48_15675 [Xanthomonas cerealis pv. cerealis]|uniref:Uncharacterized protein n=1 Tax=Xanthomonas cerealis pv. cerealis TaxID=152263 RepID=A0A514EGL9_9XANT|nr:hypothetical protein [Xanthomonas translucens]QDI04933.1 hypothetical protein E4A48_15675 [Xanthomonas translucens pv. cerealis]
MSRFARVLVAKRAMRMRNGVSATARFRSSPGVLQAQRAVRAKRNSNDNRAALRCSYDFYRLSQAALAPLRYAGKP